MEHFMTYNKTGEPKEFRKRFKNYDIIIDKGKVVTAIVVVSMIILFTLFLFYLADVF